MFKCVLFFLSNDESHYGYRCLCVGYEDISAASQRHGLASLEMELAYAGAQCASRLLAPDLEVPSLDPGNFISSMRYVLNMVFKIIYFKLRILL